MNLKLGGKLVASHLGLIALVFSTVAFSKETRTDADNDAERLELVDDLHLNDRVELENGGLIVRVGDGLFIHDFLTGKTSITALNRTFEEVKVGSVVRYIKPSIGTSDSMFLKEGYFNFTESKGVGELAEALSGRWAASTKARNCNGLFRKAETDTADAIDTCLGNNGMMQCDAAIERAAQSWRAFDICINQIEP